MTVFRACPEGARGGRPAQTLTCRKHVSLWGRRKEADALTLFLAVSPGIPGPPGSRVTASVLSECVGLGGCRLSQGRV